MENINIDKKEDNKKEDNKKEDNKKEDKLKYIKNNKKLVNNDLEMLLNEAKNITLNDLDFDNVLKEQGQILCNINNILNTKNDNDNDKNKTCNINNFKSDLKFKQILDKYKLISKKKNKALQSKQSKINYPSNKLKLQLSKMQYKPKKQIKNKNINSNQSTKYIHKITKKKYLYKHNNKRKYAISITNPKIYIKNI